MAGTDTVRGIAYQQAHAIHAALDLVDSGSTHSLRVEGMDDVVDIEILDVSGALVGAQQVKSRLDSAWSPKPIAEIMLRWAALNAGDAQFAFTTNGELGPGAQELRDALANTDPDRITRLAEVLKADEDIVTRLRDARIRVDPSSVGALLTFAERRVASMLDPLERDRDRVASQRVDALFRVLTERASHAAPEARVVTAEELRSLVGGAYGQLPTFQWDSELKTRFVEAVSGATTELVALKLLRVSTDQPPVSIESLAAGKAVALSGPTGTGKSSAVRMLQAACALSGRAVIVCRAETYTPGHLDALVADSMGFTLNRAIPTYSGRQALADPDTVIVVDGVSEIPDAIAERLAEDLRAVLTRPDLARTILIGRDLPTLRRVLARADVVDAFTVAPLDSDAQHDLVSRVVGDSLASEERTQVLQRAQRSLGDESRSPLALTIYLEASRDSDGDLSRARVYERFIEQLADRAPSADARASLPVLGSVYAQLLKVRRRYADPYEWTRITDEVATTLSSPVDGAAVREAARSIGLVTEVGATGIIAPFHDSLADYLAATAVVSDRATFPDTLGETHTEWVLFSAELGRDVSGEVVRRLPFLAVRASKSDNHFSGADGFSVRIAALLDTLVGVPGHVIQATEALDGRWKIEATSPAGVSLGIAVIYAGRGPLYAAVRLWRLVLRARVNAARPSPSRRPSSAQDAEALVTQFVRARQRVTSELLSSFPGIQRAGLLEELRPLGVSFHVGEPEEILGVTDYRMTYTSTTETRALSAEPSGRFGQTVVGDYLDSGPARSAQSSLLTAIEQLTDTSGWLA